MVDREVGAPNPWAGERDCDRSGCLDYQGKEFLAAEHCLGAYH